MAFKEVAGDQAYLKAGLMGFAGSGKTYTAKEIAIGLHKYAVSRGAMKGNDPVYFLDTETGSDWVKKDFEKAGIKLLVDKTTAFTNLIPAVRQVSKKKGILIIDSVTHFWRELTTSYAKAKNRHSLTFQDWGWLKGKWADFTTEFVNSQAHILLCGRAGFEYDYFQQDDGKMELAKTGIKMKAEGETGYEPSILILMNRDQEIARDKSKGIFVTHTAQVLKDRSTLIDGQIFKNPTFESFLPHIECLNLGGEHIGVDVSENSRDMVPADARDWHEERKKCEVVLDEIKETVAKLHPGASQAAKTAKADLLEKHFKSRSWKRIETYKRKILEEGYQRLLKEEAANVPSV